MDRGDNEGRVWPGVVAVDGVAAVGLFVFAVFVIQANRDLGPVPPATGFPSWPVTVVILFAIFVPVATRRLFPAGSLLVATSAVCVSRVVDLPEAQLSSVGLFLSLYGAGRWGTAPWRDRARGLSIFALVAIVAWSVARERVLITEAIVPDRAYYLLSMVGIAANAAYLILSWLLGDSARQRAERTEELAARTIELERSREENAAKAVVEERLRIARELHDVVAHHVSVMGIQAAATRRVVDQRPDRVVPGLEAIEQASREAVVELQRLLGFLRRDEGDTIHEASAAGEVPMPGLANLGVMRRHLADAGLALSLTTTGEARPVPAAVDVSAYRILQESLTNVLKHAATDQASVALDYGPTTLTVRVSNGGVPRRPGSNGTDGANDTNGTGSGLVGIRERSALVGGTVTAGPADGDRFVVEAVLPYEGRPIPSGR